MARRLRSSAGKPSERGASLILLTFMCITVVIPMVGLAIDGSMMYWIKAKLSAAADAAALAGARSLSVTGTFATRQSVGTATADQYFAANYPSGFLGTTVVGGTPTVAVTQSSSAVLTVKVTATVNAPLYFMRILGFNTTPISATATSARRNVNILLVLDRSGSMSANSTCSTMIADAELFTSYFTDGFDTLGLVTFSTSANLDYTPTLYFKSGNPTINSQIAKISCAGATSSTHGLQVAYSQIQTMNQTGTLNVIVFFTDGQPNVVVSDAWPVKTQADTRYNYSSTSTLSSVAKSSCASTTTLSGGMTTLLSTGMSPGVTGYTGGLFSYAGVPITSPGSTTPLNYSGCSFSSQSYGLPVRNDVAYIPETDRWGYSTSGYKAVARFPSGYTYGGYIRDDEQTTGVIAAAFNTADNLGSIIRNDSNYSTIIYTIGLGGTADAVDETFLQRLANDPRSPVFDSTIPAGKFAYAPNASQLSDAFRQIASQILRLSM